MKMTIQVKDVQVIFEMMRRYVASAIYRHFLRVMHIYA